MPVSADQSPSPPAVRGGTPSRPFSTTLVLTILAAAGLVGAATFAKQSWAASSAASASLAHHAQVLSILNDLTVARGAQAALPETRRPAPGLTGQVTDALAETGVPIQTLTNLTPDAEAAVPGAVNIRRQTARLTLDSITLPALGRFLQAWRTRHPEWVVAAIQVLPVPNTPPPGPTDAPAPVHVNLTIECTYVDAS